MAGIQKPVRIYEILEIASRADSALKEWVAAFHAALDLFEAREWKEAAVGFNRVLFMHPHDGPAQLYIRRCEQFLASPPEKSWDGIFTLNEK